MAALQRCERAISDRPPPRVPETLELSLEDVVAAGRVLFGPGFVAEGLGWRDALRTTYRRRAMETHPDRARAVGRTESDLAREFRKVADAYRVLSGLVAGPLPAPAPRAAPPPPPPRARPAPRPRPAAPGRPRAAEGAAHEGSRAHGRPRSSAAPPPRPRAESAAGAGAASPRSAGPRVRVAVRPEDLPRRRLRLAEYLYYSGRVPWTALVEAVAWQRSQRPALGRLAVDWGFVSPGDVASILERRRAADQARIPFGEYAVRLGYLTSFQLLALLGRQLRLQRRIGEFFVARGFLADGEIDEIRRRLARHNARWPE
jgi:hypothetical protein